MTITPVYESEKVLACLSEFTQAIQAEQIQPITYSYGVKRWPMPNWHPSTQYGKAYDHLCVALQKLFYDPQGFVLVSPRVAFFAETGIEILYIGTTIRDRMLDDGIRFMHQGALIYARSPVHTRPC